MRVLVTMLALAGLLTGVSMATVFDVLLTTGRLLEELREGAATAAGTTATLIDTTLSAAEGHADDEWNGGSLFLKSSVQGATPTVTNEAVATLAGATSLTDALAATPVISGSVTLSVPGATATDAVAGTLRSAAVTVSDEAASGASGSLANANPVAGTLKMYGPDGVELARDNALGSLLKMTDAFTSEALGTLTGGRTFSGTTLNHPIVAGSVTFESLIDVRVSAVYGTLISTPTTVTDEAFTPLSLFVMGHAQIVPESIDVYRDAVLVATSSSTSKLIANNAGWTGVPAGSEIGTVDYADGTINNTIGYDTPGGTWTVNYQYRFVDATIYYQTGVLDVTYSDYQASRNIVISYSGVSATPGAAVGGINYTTGDWTYSGAIALATADYQYRAVNGTITYATGALDVTFSEALTGAVTATYSYTSAFRTYIPLVTDFAVSTGTLTFSPANTGYSIGLGDTYGLMHRRYPRWVLFQKLNEALAEIKQYVLDQTDILTSALVQNETALADSVRVFAVWNGNMTQTPRDWQPVTRYRHANGRLQFYDYLFGDTIRIQYYGDTTPIDDEQDAIPATLDALWLAYETAVKCARWRLFQPGADKESQTLLVNDLMARRNAQKARANVINPNPTAFRTAVIPER